MPKPQYVQAYRKEWEKMLEFKNWIEPVPNNNLKVKCKYCNTLLASKLCDLKKHLNTAKHLKSMEPFSNQRQRKLKFVPHNNLENKEAQAFLALFIAEHCAILAADHLTALCKARFSDSKAVIDLKMNHTKCTALMRNVIGPYFLTILVKDIGENYYSLIIDESTDISTEKMLGVVIRYYSTQNKCVVSTFLGLEELEDGTARSIVKGVNNLLLKSKLNRNKLLALETDNASVMIGINNGVYTVIKNEWNLPNLILIKCTCHSLQLALSHASIETLPRNIKFLVKEIYSWFSCSTKRQKEYSQIYKLIYNNSEPLKIPSVADTRWVSIEPAIRRVVGQWEELKLHFNLMRKNCYSAELIYCMLCDKKNFVYMIYLRSILNDFQKLIKTFEGQKDKADPTKLLTDLVNLTKLIASRIINPTARVNVLTDNIDSYLDPNPILSWDFYNVLQTLDEPEEVKKTIKSRCIDFTVKLLKELWIRLPENIDILQKMSLFSVSNCLNPVILQIADLAQYFGFTNEIENILLQWNNLHTVNWSDKSNTCKFWAEVQNYKDATGEIVFKELVSLALKFLSLPHSNAEVERIFSQMNIVTNKSRNRLISPTLRSILPKQFGLKRNEKFCSNFQFSKKNLEKIGTNEPYANDSDKNEDYIDNILFCNDS